MYHRIQAIYTEHYTTTTVPEQQYNKGIMNSYKSTMVSIKRIMVNYNPMKSCTYKIKSFT